MGREPRTSALWAASALLLAALCLTEEAIRCPPCSEEKLARCSQPANCEETVREPGCGCCPTCALPKGAPCGVYSPRCGSGLRCYPPRGVDKPLHSLMHGHGVCTDEREVEQLMAAEKEEQLNLDHPNNSHIPCSPQDKKCIQKQIARQQREKGSNQKTKNNREDPKPALAPCRADLQRALERLASHTRTHEDLYTIPIPNCDKNGDFNPKQCHPARDGQRGKCWCVDQKTGIRLTNPQDMRVDQSCQQLAADPQRK
ncbi:insulin-like growth factor-binding protein 4 isoform X1 [Lepisosteus oculatus]|uniref:insulin-like growth factor-binding protein 4 isoform X1 n=1 Tax=Lepisosteus oculatus TaxID=7918 RepID=UPI0007402A12|nr:PREDICTED: insulin-like growth factor-binding protein 4 isoform X1 [Lepisosteus oculatus]XP_015217833.1 PREDICTED: insulin-like growth factor-binding protein 4 isoform X1 [Lepisosteus oculatus]XP_015217835.1 PREDICTED: insulin-like growth factor-binding protein 4 isoform X1 [Lepisosteus oculatus]